MRQTAEQSVNDVHVLEKELKRVKAAFQEYISSSKELEDGFDTELAETRSKLVQSSQANEALAAKLHAIEPVVVNLEVALEDVKARLREEQRLRQQEEITRLETEILCQEQDKVIDQLKEEMEKLRNGQRQDAGSVSRSLGTASPNSVRSKLNSKSVNSNLADDTYVEILDELETVTEQFIDAQRKLHKTEDDLKDEIDKVRRLEKIVSEKHGKSVLRQVEEDGRLHREETRKLQGELNRVKEELQLAREELQGESDDSEDGMQPTVSGRVELLERMLQNERKKYNSIEENLEQYVMELDETRERNMKLADEVLCLRESLHDAIQGKYDKNLLDTSSDEDDFSGGLKFKQSISEQVRAAVLKETKAEREKEINLLREKFKKLFKENSALQRKVEESGKEASKSQGLKEEVTKCKEEIARLNVALKDSKQGHKFALSDVESSWRKKLEEAKKSLDDCQKSLSAARKENTKLQKSEGSLKASRDEILKLKEMVQSLNASLDESNATVDEYNEALKQARRDTAQINTELVESNQLHVDKTEEASLLMDENNGLKQRVQSLDSALDQTAKDNADLLAKLEFATDQLQKIHNGEARNTIEVESWMARDNGGMVESIAQHQGAQSNEQSLVTRILEENRSLRERLHAHEDTAAMLRSELETAQSNVARLSADLTEQEALLLERSNVVHGDVVSGGTDKEKVKALRSVRQDGENPIILVSSESEESTSVEKLKLSLMISKDEIMILKRQVERLKAALDESVADHAGELANLRRSLQLPSGGEVGNKYSENDLQEPDQDKKALTKALLDENGFLQEKLEATEKSLVEMEDRHRMKEEMMRMYEVGFNSYEESLNWSADETLKLRNEISELKSKLEIAEKKSHGDSTNVEMLQSMPSNADTGVDEMEDKLNASKASLAESEAQKIELRKKIATLKTSLVDERKNLDRVTSELEIVNLQCAKLRTELDTLRTEKSHAERQNEVQTLRDELERANSEKAKLQHQVDDSKIALSVSQYEQEKCREDLRSCEAQLASYRGEVLLLRNEPVTSSTVLTVVKNDLAGDDDMQGEVSVLEKELKQVVTDKSELRLKVDDLSKALHKSQFELQLKRDALAVSERELHSQSEKLVSMEGSLVSSQEETRMLTEEISHLSAALENAKIEYDAVVDELEAVNELFDEARQEAEKSGREAATEEIRHQNRIPSEQEWKQAKEQLKKILQDNAVLQRKLDETERSLALARSVQHLHEQHEGLESSNNDELCKLAEALGASKLEARKFQNEAIKLKAELERATENHTRVQAGSTEVQADQDGRIMALNHQLSGLVAENSTLQLKLRNTNASLEAAQNTNARRENELVSLRRALQSAREDSLNLEGNVSTLTALEAAKNDCKPEEHSIPDVMSSVQRSISSSTAGAAEAKEKELELLHSKLLESQGEAARLKAKIVTLTESLQQKTNELTALSRRFNAACDEAEMRGRDKAAEEMRNGAEAEQKKEILVLKDHLNALMEEKVALQQEVDDTKISMSVSAEELKGLRTALESSRSKAASLQDELNKRTHELLTAKKVLTATTDHTMRELITAEFKDKPRELRAKLDECLAEKLVLEKQLKSMEAALSTSKDDQEKQREEIESCENKIKTWKKEALFLRGEVSKLKGALENANKGHVYLRDQLETVNRRVYNLCKEAEERGRATATAEMRAGVMSVCERHSSMGMDHCTGNVERPSSDSNSLSPAGQRMMDTNKFDELEAGVSDVADRAESTTQAGSNFYSTSEVDDPQKEFETLGMPHLEEETTMKSSASIALEQEVDQGESTMAEKISLDEAYKEQIPNRFDTTQTLQAQFEKTAEEIARIDQEMNELDLLFDTGDGRQNVDEATLENKITLEEAALPASEAGLVFRTSQNLSPSCDENQERDDGGAVDSRGEFESAEKSPNLLQAETRDDVEKQNAGHPRPTPDPPKTLQTAQTDSSGTLLLKANVEVKRKRWKEALETSRARRLDRKFAKGLTRPSPPAPSSGGAD